MCVCVCACGGKGAVMVVVEGVLDCIMCYSEQGGPRCLLRAVYHKTLFLSPKQLCPELSAMGMGPINHLWDKTTSPSGRQVTNGPAFTVIHLP